MTGVIVNTFAVILGSFLGLILKKGIPEKVSSAVMTGIGLCTVYIGLSGSLSGENVLIVICSMVIGSIIGTLLDVDGKINLLGKWVENRVSSNKKSNISQGFVTGSLFFCIGAITIVGSLNAGLQGDNELLFTKSLLDIFLRNNVHHNSRYRHNVFSRLCPCFPRLNRTACNLYRAVSLHRCHCGTHLCRVPYDTSAWPQYFEYNKH